VLKVRAVEIQGASIEMPRVLADIRADRHRYCEGSLRLVCGFPMVDCVDVLRRPLQAHSNVDSKYSMAFLINRGQTQAEYRPM
jgi:hypothetical protein